MPFSRKNLKSNILIIFALGFSSGLPLALLLSTLKVFLVDLKVDIKTIGAFSLIALPYSLKFLWAPIIDSAKLPFLTKRRSWIFLTQILLIIFIIGLGFYGKSGSLSLIIIFSLLIAFSSATQDLVIDAYRIENFQPQDQGIAASSYVYGYRIGMLVSGAFALVLSDNIPWHQVYYIISLTIIIGIIATLFAKEISAIKTKPSEDFISWIKSSVVAPLADFLQRPKWYIIFPFIILFKLCDAFAGSITLPFLIEIGFSKTEIATIVKTFGLVATLLGALGGGFLVKKIGLIKSLWIAGIMQAISNLVFCLQAQIGYNISSLYFVIFIENFSGGIGDVVFIAYLSSLCNIAFTATQYSILISFASLGRAVISSSAGIFAANFGWVTFYFFSSLLAIPSLVLLFFLNRKFKISNTKLKGPISDRF
jgi:PAT family beta-lactamase induction signal transducer AmpG